MVVIPALSRQFTSPVHYEEGLAKTNFAPANLPSRVRPSAGDPPGVGRQHPFGFFIYFAAGSWAAQPSSGLCGKRGGLKDSACPFSSHACGLPYSFPRGTGRAVGGNL